MHFPLAPLVQLERLSQALTDPGDDLQSILAVLIDDLTAAVPAFTGLLLTIPVEGELVTISVIGAPTAAASMLLPLHLISDLQSPSELVFYAAEPGAFTGLAADARAAYGLGGDVEVDRHLPPPADTGIAVKGPLHRSIINQAIGVLIAQGHAPDRARRELVRRAEAANVPPLHVAAELLEHATPPSPQPPDGPSTDASDGSGVGDGLD